MTLIDYAKYLLSVCGRRFTHLYRRHYLESTPALPSLSALLSYLRTQTATIYAYLQTRFAGDPTSGIPSITPTQPLTFANLLTNIEKLKNRKIDAGASTQIPEGISLVRLLCDTTAASAVTELIDTNNEYTMNKSFDGTLFNNVTKLNLKCKKANVPLFSSAFASVLTQLQLDELTHAYTLALPEGNMPTEYTFPKLKYIYGSCSLYTGNGDNTLKVLRFPELEELGSNNGELETVTYPYFMYSDKLYGVEEIYMPKLRIGRLHGIESINLTSLKKIVFGKLESLTSSYWGSGYPPCIKGDGKPNLLYVEFGEGTNISINIKYWQPTLDTEEKTATFLTNFRQYLFLRLADRTATTALTLTLSSAVYTALTTETSTLAELGITTLTDKEQAAGITLATAYNTWLDTYRAAINWNITNAG